MALAINIILWSLAIFVGVPALLFLLYFLIMLVALLISLVAGIVIGLMNVFKKIKNKL